MAPLSLPLKPSGACATRWLSRVEWTLRDKATEKQALRSPDPAPIPSPPTAEPLGASSLGRGGQPLPLTQPTRTHTPTYMPACLHTHTHMHACTQTHICQARSPPQHGDLPSPPLDLCLPLPHSPPGWLIVIYGEQVRALTRWPWWAPSWLTNLETLNRGSRVLQASLPPLAAALGEGQERRRAMNELSERGAGPGGGEQQASGAVPLEVTRALGGELLIG